MKPVCSLVLLGILAFVTPGVHAQLTVQQGSAGAALPPFGGYVPGQGAMIAFGSPGAGGLAFSAGQGSSRSSVSQSGSLTVANGGFGMFASGTWRPFVIGYEPVVSSFPSFPVNDAFFTSPDMLPMNNGMFAERVNDVERRERRKEAAIRRLIERAERAKGAGQILRAKRYYAMAARRSTDAQKADLEKLILKLEE